MNTPLMSTTTALSRRTSRDQLTASELVLGFVVATALAVVAALAMAMPSTIASATDQSADTPTVSHGQVARGKATPTLLGSASQIATSPLD